MCKLKSGWNEWRERIDFPPYAVAHLAWYLGLLAVGFPHNYSARDSPPWGGGHCSDVFHSLENELQVSDTAHTEPWWPLESLGFCWCLSFRDSAPSDILMNMKRDYRVLGYFDILNKALCLQTAEPHVIKKDKWKPHRGHFSSYRFSMCYSVRFQLQVITAK